MLERKKKIIDIKFRCVKYSLNIFSHRTLFTHDHEDKYWVMINTEEKKIGLIKVKGNIFNQERINFLFNFFYCILFFSIYFSSIFFFFTFFPTLVPLFSCRHSWLQTFLTIARNSWNARMEMAYPYYSVARKMVEKSLVQVAVVGFSKTICG